MIHLLHFLSLYLSLVFIHCITTLIFVQFCCPLYCGNSYTTSPSLTLLSRSCFYVLCIPERLPRPFICNLLLLATCPSGCRLIYARDTLFTFSHDFLYLTFLCSVICRVFILLSSFSLGYQYTNNSLGFRSKMHVGVYSDVI